MSKTCPNCDADLTGPFCAGCGQKDMDLRRALWSLLAEFFAETFETDGRLAHTLPLFVLHPARLVEDFVAGKRQRYTSPIRLLVFALAAGFFLLGITGDLALDSFSSAVGDAIVTVNDGKASFGEQGNQFNLSFEDGGVLQEKGQLLHGRTQAEAMSMLMTGWLGAAPTMVLLLVPTLTLIIELLFPRFLAIKHLLLSVLLHALGLLLIGLALLTQVDELLLATLAYLAIQLFVAFKTLYRKGWIQTLFKWWLAVLLYAFCFTMAVVGALLLALYNL